MDRGFVENLSEIGGRWAISLRAGMFIFPFFIFSIPILESNFHDSKNFLDWTSVSLLASIPSVLIVYVADLTYFRDRIIKPKPAYTVPILGFLVGAIKGFLVEVLAFEKGLVSGSIPNQIIVRTLNSAILGAAAFVLIALSLGTMHSFRLKKRELLDQLAFQLSKNAHISTLDASINVTTPSGVRDEINQMLHQARLTFKSKREQSDAEPSELIAMLKNTAEDVVRPLSHTLYAKSLERIPKMSLLQTLKALSIYFQIEVPIIAVAFFVFSFKNVFSINGLNKTLVLLTCRTLLFALILWLVKILFSKLIKFMKYSFVVAALIAVTIFSMIDFFINTSLGYEIDLGKIFLSITWNLTIVLVAGFLVAITDVNRYQLETLREQIDELAIDMYSTSLQQRYLYRTYSKILHGVYHSRLMASSVAIQNAANSGNLERLNSELDKAEALLLTNFESNLSKLDLTEDSLFQELTVNWLGVIDLVIENACAKKRTDYQLLALSEFLSESITNAYRHGRASEVLVEMRDHSSGGTQVSVYDNGVGYIKSFPGLGSSIFEELSHGEWEIHSRKDSSGAVVNIVIQPEEIK